ncbi:FAST kinase domain-containing protein 4-like [Glandiceps talaboti]
MAAIILRRLAIRTPVLRTCLRPVLSLARCQQCSPILSSIQFLPNTVSNTMPRTFCVVAEDRPLFNLDRLKGNIALTKLNEAKTVDDIFKTVSECQLNEEEAAFTISQLHRFCKIQEDVSHGDVTKDDRFDQLCRIIGQNVMQLSPGSVVSSLRNLLYMGVDYDHYLVKSLEYECKWRLRKFSFRHLTILAAFYSQFMKTKMQCELMRDIVRVLELRWTEINQPKSLLILMARVSHLSPMLMEKLEDKALEMAEQLSQEDARRVALILANQNRRSIPLLRALAYHIVQRQYELELQVMMDICFAFAKLNFHHQELFEKILAELLRKLPKCNPRMVASFSKSFSYLKWLSYPLFDATSLYVVENLQHFKQQQLTNMILSYARLNFQPKNSDAFFKEIIPQLDLSVDSLKDNILIDVVWSLAILQAAPGNYLGKVLNSEFQERMSDGTSFLSLSNRLKLLHINTAAKLECNKYQGPYLSDDFIKSTNSVTGRRTTALQVAVQQTLVNVMGGDQFVHNKVLTPYGYQLDAECLIDSEINPLNPEKYKSLGEDDDKLDLPDGARRLAVLAWDYQNYCYQSKDLLGRYVMAKRHLKKVGYTLVEVPYYEWNDMKSEWQRAAFIKDRINKAIAAEAAT